MLVQIFFLPAEHITQQAGRFVVEVMARRHHIIFMFQRHAVELVPFDGAAGRAGRTVNQHGQFLDAGPRFLFDGVDVEDCAMRRGDGLGELDHFGVGHFRIAADAEIDVQRVGFVAHLEEHIPERQAVFAA